MVSLLSGYASQHVRTRITVHFSNIDGIIVVFSVTLQYELTAFQQYFYDLNEVVPL
jgi:hypothetical protein